jgi:EAL domain-containing protein (putative c-di-GMP-specific phosphodiesterase class I)
LLQALALWKVNPKNIVLEITENGILELNETTNPVINELAENGFRFALDDFGTGFSSLSRLRTMPIDLIKIDQSFVRDISRSNDDFEIVKSIALLANSLGKEVLAEGVEDKECLDLIKKMKIHKCQGYYFSKPMPFDKFVRWAKQH